MRKRMYNQEIHLYIGIESVHPAKHFSISGCRPSFAAFLPKSAEHRKVIGYLQPRLQLLGKFLTRQFVKHLASRGGKKFLVRIEKEDVIQRQFGVNPGILP